MEELIARVRALVRRSTGVANSVMRAGAVTLDTRRMTVSVDGAPLDVTQLEFRLLSYLMHHRERVISQIELTEHVYGEDIERDSNAIEVLVARVRRKLGVDFIRTRRGFGYTIPGDDVLDAND